MPTTETLIYPEGVELKIARIRAGLRQYEVATSVGILPNRLSEKREGGDHRLNFLSGFSGS